ncbi:MAG: helix-turn-helix transcriptional regulator [Clostridia bacterium]|nr:helix-turn-helix transcriptional regulator [Clostridia bacterium]
MFAKEILAKDIKTIKWHWQQDEYSFLNVPRSCYGILAVTKGRVDYILNDKVISLKQGHYIYLPKNSLYKARFHINEGEVETILVNFDLEEGHTLAIPPFYNAADKTLQFETALRRILALEDEENVDYLKQAYFFYCLHVMHSNYISNSVTDTELISKTKQLLKSSEKSIEQIAEELKISASGLRKKFKDATGFSPADWRCQRRIETAKHLLLTSDLSIDAIAEQTGFYDTPYFYKKFQSIVGTTPKKYRKTDITF